MELKNKKVVVVGFGLTGQAVCDFLLSQEASVLVSDNKPESELDRVNVYKARGVHFDTGANRLEILLQADLVVLSPGVPPLPEVMAAREKGIVSVVAGHSDILVVPDIEAGNMLAKQLTFLGHADAAAIVLGARVPIILTSRADSVRTRLLSCVVALYLAHAHRSGSIRSEQRDATWHHLRQRSVQADQRKIAMEFAPEIARRSTRLTIGGNALRLNRVRICHAAAQLYPLGPVVKGRIDVVRSGKHIASA